MSVVVPIASDAAADVAMFQRVLEKEGFATETCTDPACLAATVELARPVVLVLARTRSSSG